MKKDSLPNIRIIYKGLAEKQQLQKPYSVQSYNTKKKNKQPYDFRNKLDIRDQIIRVPLKIQKQSKMESSQFQAQLLQWLAYTVENIFSVTFRFILENKLTIEQGKAYASKNILLNIKQGCEEVATVLNQKIDAQFMQYLNYCLSEIISQVINKYPQQNAMGASNKVKQFIKKISNRESDQFDFLLNYHININYNPNGDYSEQIMKTINKIINAPQQTRQQDSLFRQFQIFCTELFYYSSKKDNQKIKESVVKDILVQQKPSIENLDQQKKSISDIRNTIEGRKSLQKLVGIQTHYQLQKVKIQSNEQEAKEITESFGQLSQQILQFQLKQGKNYSICQKIPCQVKLFSQKQIRSGNFKVHHASILRVMTKWAESLYQKLDEATEKIRYRIHKFKTNSQKRRFCQVQEKQFLYQAALSEKIIIDKYLRDLKKQNIQLQGVFSTQIQQGLYLKKYTNVDIFAGRIEEIVNQLTFKYLNRLIHSMLNISLQAGQQIYDHYKIYKNNEEIAEKKQKKLKQINLVSLKVGDLLRARFICHQYQFINVLTILYKIQQIDSSFIKIVAIKNRLDDNNNDILINLFFKNKILCQLQLSIFKEINIKQKLYSQFNHFIYELKRSEFGIISALSNTIAQYDPIVNYFTFNKHKPPTLMKKILIKRPATLKQKDYQHSPREDVKLDYITKGTIQKHIEKPFICSQCKNLKIVHNPKFYNRNSKELEGMCNECIQKYLITDPSRSGLIIEDLFKYYIFDDKNTQFAKNVRIWNPNAALFHIKDEKDLYFKFLTKGFVIEKGQKLPKVHYFRKFYNQMANNIILTTIINGQILNFLHLDCKKQKQSFKFLNEINKYLFFEFDHHIKYKKQYLTKIGKQYISQQNEQADMLQVQTIDQEEVIKRQIIDQILKSFQKNYTTLYLNNYKFVLDYLEQHIYDLNQAIKLKKIEVLRINALNVVNLQLQQCQIYTISKLITQFVNLKEINLSNNYISNVEYLKDLRNLQYINISNNNLTSIQTLSGTKELQYLIASHNNICNLNNFKNIKKLTKLDLSYNSINSIKELREMNNLGELNLFKNKISSMTGIENLILLEKLILSYNQIEEIIDISKLTRLKQLDLSSNIIEQFPNFVSQKQLLILNLSHNLIAQVTKLLCSNVMQLNLSSNKLIKMKHFQNLINLETLNLQFNYIQIIQSIDKMQKLKYLNLNNNKIQNIQNLQIKSLQSLILSNNPIKQIANINHLKNLVKLDVNTCKIDPISNINKLKKVSTLNFSHNHITQIDQIDQLVRVSKLDLGFNKITKIQNLGTLKYLQNLSLMGNQITKIENLDLLSELKWIILSKNKITKLENLNCLEGLRKLQLQHNLIEKIQNLQEFTELNQLWLSFNHLNYISNLAGLSKLKRLGLAHNFISKIDGLVNLASLQFLDLQANKIQVVQNLDKLVELKWLVLSLNKIKTITGLSKLKKLETLFMEYNQIEVIQNLQKLRRLNYLILSFNKIKKIEGLHNLEDLEKLYLEGNLIQKIQNLESQFNLNELMLHQNKISKMQNLEQLVRLTILNLSQNKIQKISSISTLKCLKKVELRSNKILSIDKMDVSTFIEEIVLMQNPILKQSIQPALLQKVKLTQDNQIIDFIEKNLLNGNDRPKSINNIMEGFMFYEHLLNQQQKNKLILPFTKTFVTQE